MLSMCWNPRPKVFMRLKNLHIANLDNPLTMKEPPAQRIKFTNLGQSRKLLFDTLNEVNCSAQENRVSLCCPREDSLVATEQLDVMLEFQREFNDLMTPFPPPIHLSVYGSDSQRSVNKAAGEENHLKVIQDVAESRFRDVTRASSAFPASDARLCAVPKLPSLGKHKLSSDSAKPPKSKHKKTSIKHSNIRQFLLEPGFQPMPPTAPITRKDPN